MNRKISIGLCISLIIMAVTATFAITMVSSRQIYNSIFKNLAMREGISRAIDEIDNIVASYFYNSEAAEQSSPQINSSLIEGYVNGLGDANSRYLSAEEYDEYQTLINGGLYGIGVEAAFDEQKGQLVAAYVYEDSPAANAGLKRLDTIVSIDGTAVTKYNYESLTEKFYGNAPLTTVEIEYTRSGAKGHSEPMLSFAIPSVTGSMIEKVGYIRITGFYKNTAGLLEETVEKLRSSGAQSFIFDVRGTTQGTVPFAAEAVDAVVSTNAGNIAVARKLDGSIYKDMKYVASVSKVSEPVVVLVNAVTAGPAELFACDLRDMRNADIVGITTKGNGMMQDVFALEDGGAVILTVALVEPNKGTYDGTGVAPSNDSCAVELNQNSSSLLLVEAADDTQLQRALALLSK